MSGGIHRLHSCHHTRAPIASTNSLADPNPDFIGANTNSNQL
jgi:hypothetical protein